MKNSLAFLLIGLGVDIKTCRQRPGLRDLRINQGLADRYFFRGRHSLEGQAILRQGGWVFPDPAQYDKLLLNRGDPCLDLTACAFFPWRAAAPGRSRNSFPTMAACPWSHRPLEKFLLHPAQTN